MFMVRILILPLSQSKWLLLWASNFYLAIQMYDNQEQRGKLWCCYEYPLHQNNEADQRRLRLCWNFLEKQINIR